MGLAFLVLLCVSCVPPRDPLLNSVVSAHGNTDWHKDTAQEFLDGKNLSGTPVAANFAPASWSKRHIHTGMSNTADYYYDTGEVASGLDTDGTNGIDTSMLFFYAGHGNPDLWDTLGNRASQGNMLLANQAQGGLLRYYWQCSCEVFAHGARTCTGTSDVYACPGTFDGSADSNSMRNVYERWGPVLTMDLRMACGSSTDAWCWGGEVNGIWNNYNNSHYYVSDAFVYGLQTNHSNVVPVCITLGGSDWTATPLWDLTFTNVFNTAGTSRYHLQYGYHFTSTPRTMSLLEIPEALPVLKLKPMPLPEPLAQVEFKQDGEWQNSSKEIEGRGPEVRVNSLSGAVYVMGATGGFADGKALGEEDYVRLATNYLEKLGWSEKTSYEPIGDGIRLQSIPVEGNRQDIQEAQKNVTIAFKRQADVGGSLVNVLGPGGIMVVQMNNDGSLLNADKVWREVAEEGEILPVKSYEQALADALRQIAKPENYTLGYWNWGYKELDGNVEQTEMRIVFQFDFVPVKDEFALENPPITIEVPGQ
jgi:hypothetical protein